MGYADAYVEWTEAGEEGKDWVAGAVWAGTIVSATGSRLLLDGRNTYTDDRSVCVVSIMRIVHVHSAAERGDVSSKWPATSLYVFPSHHPYTELRNPSLTTHR